MDAVPASYYDGLNAKLLQAIPPDARRVLELGCANGRLGARFKSVSPATVWHGVDLSAEAVEAASAHLDLARRMDLDADDLSTLEGGYDVVVIGDLLEHLREPGRVLEALYDLTAPGATIVACVPNMSNLEVVERLLAGDIGYDPAGLLDATHLRFFSPSSLFRTLLDAGWLPHLQDEYATALPATPFAARVVDAAVALGLPAATARRNLSTYQMIVVARKWSMACLRSDGPAAALSVIVPVNRPWQFRMNVARSPGLAEIGATVIPVQGASSAADAWARGLAQSRTAWTMMAHQDVYFPRGTGLAVAARLGALERAGRTRAPVGFAGLVRDPSREGVVRYAGRVVDRRVLFDHGAHAGAVSMDELAVVLHRDAGLAPEPTLGWHLWATDLCLRAEAREGRPVAELLEVPLFHNSVGDWVVPPDFHASAARLLELHPSHTVIPTLCGSIERPRAAALA